jgi:hypothetical protein
VFSLHTEPIEVVHKLRLTESSFLHFFLSFLVYFLFFIFPSSFVLPCSPFISFFFSRFPSFSYAFNISLARASFLYAVDT